MKHQELKAFTHKELSCLKHMEISEDKIVLLAKYRNSEMALTENARLKLYEVCKVLPDAIPEKSKLIPQELKTFGDAITFILSLFEIWDKIKNIYPEIKTLIDDFFTFIN